MKQPAIPHIDTTRPLVRVLRRTVVPLSLLVLAPAFVMLLWHTIVVLDGSFVRLLDEIASDGLLSTVGSVWGPVFFGSPAAWAMIGIFAAVQLALMRLVPGRLHEGPVTPSGHVPVYKANGPASFAITLAVFAVASWGLDLFPPGIVYDHFGELVGALNVSALLLCLALYFKGRIAPSTPDSGASGNVAFDYYWGTELYPRVLGWDVKQFTNCRMGMMGWAVIVLSFAAAQHARGGLTDGMVVAVGLQLVYIAKFFWWETGYFRSLDIMHDRAGFYIVWGVLVWLPVVYTCHTLYLVEHPTHLGTPLAVTIGAVGIAAIAVNYLADRQRQRVRASGGRCLVWGRAPALVRASYRTDDGEERENLLLASGWWGLSRHFHYLPEWLAAVCWTLPVGFRALAPWFYVVFLAILLTDRAFRDEARCAAKYGADWDEYRRRVPSRIIPGIF